MKYVALISIVLWLGGCSWLVARGLGERHTKPDPLHKACWDRNGSVLFTQDFEWCIEKDGQTTAIR